MTNNVNHTFYYIEITQYFHRIGSLGRFGLVVAMCMCMSVCLKLHFFMPLICPQITWSDPHISKVIPPPKKKKKYRNTSNRNTEIIITKIQKYNLLKEKIRHTTYRNTNYKSAEIQIAELHKYILQKWIHTNYKNKEKE